MTFAWLAPFPRLLKAIQSYPRLSKAIQGYPRHQKMHGEAPRHQSEETNCGIIRCVNSHSNRSCSARARNGLTRYHFGTDFRPHSSEATIKWQGVWFTEPSNHTFRPPFKLVSKNQIYINLYKWGRIASGHSPTEKKNVLCSDKGPLQEGDPEGCKPQSTFADTSILCPPEIRVWDWLTGWLVLNSISTWICFEHIQIEYFPWIMNWCHTKESMYQAYQFAWHLVNQCEFVRPSSGIPAMAHHRFLNSSWNIFKLVKFYWL